MLLVYLYGLTNNMSEMPWKSREGNNIKIRQFLKEENFVSFI